MTKQETNQLREYLLRNVQGLITPANSGMAIALALFELADAHREHAYQLQRVADALQALPHD
jgi:hypothetical protein